MIDEKLTKAIHGPIQIKKETDKKEKDNKVNDKKGNSKKVSKND
jgi:hypothetical protein